MRSRILIAAALAVATAIAALLALARSDRATAKAHATVNVQLLAFNDFHGNIEPPSGSGGRIGTVDAGGALRRRWRTGSSGRSRRTSRGQRTPPVRARSAT